MTESRILKYWSTIGDPQLTWDGDEPRSQRFADGYASRGAALDETRHVFLAGNRLPDRFARAGNFVIAETGFGTGLNFVAAADLWHKVHDDTGVLHFISIERYPLRREQARRATSQWPAELQPIAQQLLAQWPEAEPGWHDIHLPEQHVRLRLYHGDITAIEDWEIQADCWFLDGFAPANNPEIWQGHVLQSIAENTRAGGTLATFTAAGAVRRGLEQAGFEVQRVPGFSGKRHMTTAVLPAPARKSGMPWFALPAHRAQPATRIAVIGAGIAGCATAHHLSAAGFLVDLFDSGAGPGSQASGNPAGILMPHISADPSPMSAWNNQAYLMAHRQYRQFGWQPEGLWYQPPEHTPADLLPRWLAWTGLGGPHGSIQRNPLARTVRPGLYAAAAGSIRPAQMLAKLLVSGQGPINCHWETRICKLEKSESGWHLIRQDSGANSNEYGHVVLCSGHESQLLDPFLHARIEPARGQVSLGTTTDPHDVSHVLCERGYLIPTDSHAFVTGASYERGNSSQEATAADNAENMTRLQEAYRFPAGIVVGQRVSIRATTRDHLPLVGPVPDYAACTEQYSDLYRGKAPATYANAACHRGLWLNLGHGSRGFSGAVYAASLLADWIRGDPAPLQRTVREAIHPLRFAIRDWKRGP